MNDTNWTTLQSAGKVPPPSPEVLAHATQRLEQAATRGTRRTRRRRILVPLAAATATAAVIAVLALQQPDNPTAAPATTPSVSTTTYPPSKPIGDPHVSNSCVHEYAPKWLAERPVAFDGTVLSATPAPGTMGWNVTFQVNEWFRPSTGQQRFTMLMWVGPGHQVQASDMQGYEVGDRLLTTGGARVRGGDPMDWPVVNGCGFTRTYDVPTAATWRKVFRK
ncbi:hypothetical protein ACI2LF_42725 [Kribbella sp. NPDC020789]